METERYREMIRFRDRPLEKGERSHYYCDKCGQELHPDFAYTHRCNPLTLALRRRGRWDVKKKQRFW
jgi:hypothetical protein